MGVDDRKASWEISLFLIAALVIILVVTKLRGIALESTFVMPVFTAVITALFISLVYWFVRYFRVSRKKSLVVLAALIIMVLFINIIGVKFYVVMTNSMRQRISLTALYTFWEKQGYSEEDFRNFPSSGGFQAGDLLIVSKTDNLKVGDIAVDTRRKIPITHRIFFVNDTVIMTAGDGVPPTGNISISKNEVRLRENIYGKVLFVIPKGGIVKALYSCYTGKNCDFKECFEKGNCGGISRFS